jgi:2-amino-4-hydroxy-6-hydroxymethyldihydropteridine diphosphokinase
MRVYLGLGSNLGDKTANLNKAIAFIEQRVGEMLTASSLYYSKAQGFTSENDFVNQVVLIRSEMEPLEMLHELQNIEKEMGRLKKTEDKKYQDRIIDIDILLIDDMIIDLPELKVPHPVMWERDFVMKPLNEIRGMF